ncbi:hypothetical protein D3C86_1083460 [compost metagenome]
MSIKEKIELIFSILGVLSIFKVGTKISASIKISSLFPPTEQNDILADLKKKNLILRKSISNINYLKKV